MPQVIVWQAEALDENWIVHYKKGKQLGSGYYIVEISSNSTSLFIAAYDVESSESFLITLPEKRGKYFYFSERTHEWVWKQLWNDGWLTSSNE